MTTDNRTNEPRRLKSCVEAWPECETGEYNPSCCRFPKSCSATVYSEEHVTEDDLEPPAALVAAAGAAPQAESVWVPGYGGTGVNKAARPVNGFDTTAERVKTGGDSLHVAPVLPLSGVDEDALAEVINAALDKWEGYEPSVVFVARAVAAWLKDGAQA